MEIPFAEKDISRAAERSRLVAVELEIKKNTSFLSRDGDVANLRLSFSLSAFIVARNFFCVQHISIFLSIQKCNSFLF